MNSRTIQIKAGKQIRGPVVYWMSRDQRVFDNWALIAAVQYANSQKLPVVIIFNLAGNFLEAGSRQFRFMIKGLEDVYNNAADYNIPFYLLRGDPVINIPQFIMDISASALFTDLDPLKIKRAWLNKVISKTEVPVFQTDAHNIVPVFHGSHKQEFAAVHFRRKIIPLLKEYLVEFPDLHKFEKTGLSASSPDFDAIKKEYDKPPFEVDWITPGQKSAYQAMEDFLSSRINDYIHKNDPNRNAVSGLSPYLHFGNLSSQRVVLNIEKMDADPESRAAFLEEIVVRKELSDNFCWYNQNYDKFEGFPQWGKETLDRHRDDQRSIIYSSAQFEKAETHDPLWNAAQNEMVIHGKMHGYLRMYWCKKILEWSSSPEEALQIAIYLNDKYELDGRDPNGYAGILWSVGGLHDRPFAERPVFGKVRYMNYAGCRRKFDVEKYIEKYPGK